MIVICPLLFVGWKIIKKTKIQSAAEMDLQKNMDEIAAYERSYIPNPPRYVPSDSLVNASADMLQQLVRQVFGLCVWVEPG